MKRRTRSFMRAIKKGCQRPSRKPRKLRKSKIHRWHSKAAVTLAALDTETLRRDGGATHNFGDNIKQHDRITHCVIFYGWQRCISEIKKTARSFARKRCRGLQTLKASLRYVTSSANPIFGMRDGMCASHRLGPLNVNLSFPHVNREDPRTEITGHRCVHATRQLDRYFHTSAKNTLQIQL